MSILILVSLVFTALLASVNRHQNLLPKIRQGNMYVFATAMMSPFTTVVGDSPIGGLPTEIPKPQSTVFRVPEVRCQTATCKGRCGLTSRPYRQIPCSCDIDCVIYQDCCLDFGSLCTDRNDDYPPGQIISRPEGTPPLSCVYRKTYNFVPIYMVTGCPEGYKQQGVKALCEDDTSDFVLHHLPATEGNSSFIYRNVYCAFCNSLNMTRVETFINNFHCPFNETASMEYLKKRPLHEITFTEILEARCDLQIKQVNKVGDGGRQCAKLDIDTCQEPGPIKEACESYLEPVTIRVTKQSTVARNMYCAQCSDFDESQTRCWVGRSNGINNFGPGFKFSILFDFTVIHIPGDMSVPTTPSGSSRSTDLLGSSLGRGLKHYFIDLFMSINGTKTLDHMYLLSANFANEELTPVKCLQRESQMTKNATECYHLNGTFPSLKYSIDEILALSMNLTSDLTRSLRIISGSVRNIPSRLSEVCLSSPRYYALDIFKEKVELFVQRNNALDARIAGMFPFEVLWPVGHNDIQFSNCGELSNCSTAYGGSSLPTAAVCGDTLESACEITIFDNDIRSIPFVQASQPELQENTLYQIGNTVAACKKTSQETDQLDNVELYITAIGCSLSILGLMVTIGTYCSFEQLRNLAGCCVLNLTCAVLTAQVLFVVGGVSAWRNKYACHAIGILQHFFWLASFSWTNIMAFDLACTFRGKTAFSRTQTGKKILFGYVIVGWGLPVIVVGTTAALDLTSTVTVSYGQSGICWIRNNIALLVSFVVPVTLHIIFNVVAFTFTVYNIRKISKMADSLNAIPERRGLLGVYSRITAVMGFTWLIGYLGNIWPVPALRIVFSGINSLQGFFISVAFVFTSRVSKLYRNRYFRESPFSHKTEMSSTAWRTLNTKY